MSHSNNVCVRILGVSRDTVLTLAGEFKEELRPIMTESIKAAGMGEKNTVNDTEVTVSKRNVRVADLLNAVEVFVTGTVAEVVLVQSICTSDTPAAELEGEEEEAFAVVFPHGKLAGPVTTKLLEMLREVLAEKRSSEVTTDWLCDVYASPEKFRKGGCN